MQWKIMLVSVLLTAALATYKLQQNKIEKLGLERDLVTQSLGTEQEKNLGLLNGLDNQNQVIQQQQTQIKSIVNAYNRANTRLRTLESDHAKAHQQLQAIKANQPEIADWAATAVPVAIADWLHSLNAQNHHDYTARDDKSAPAAVGRDPPNSAAPANQQSRDP